MDLSILERTDFDSLVAIELIKAARVNLKKNTVLLRVFKGATRQDEGFSRALADAEKKLAREGITLVYEVYDQAYVKNKLKWTVTQLIDWLLAADIHLIPCHAHEGNVAKTESWNLENIRSQLSRLKYHLGVPMGKHLDCCIWNQDKWEMYQRTFPLSAPSMKIPLEPGILDSIQLQ
jgi:hypothetical protein